MKCQLISDYFIRELGNIIISIWYTMDKLANSTLLDESNLLSCSQASIPQHFR
jgi:hypothetical protein